MLFIHENYKATVANARLVIQNLTGQVADLQQQLANVSVQNVPI